MPDNLLYYGDPGAPGLAYVAHMAPRLVEFRRQLGIRASRNCVPKPELAHAGEIQWQ